jgi:hypothetical protein
VPKAIKATSTRVAAEITPQGLPTSYRVEYGLTTGNGTQTPNSVLPSTSAAETAVVELTGLEPCTTYHYQALSENAANEGTPSEGGDLTFTTACGPAVTTAAATEIEPHHFDLGGTVNPNGNQTSYYFEYGATASYGSQTPLTEAGSSRADTHVSAQITLSARAARVRRRTLLTSRPFALIQFEVGHFRVVAVQAGKTYYGEDETIYETI